MLYPLSYTFDVTGVEPATSGFLVLRSTIELHVGAANLHRQNPFTEQAIPNVVMTRMPAAGPDGLSPKLQSHKETKSPFDQTVRRGLAMR